MKIRVDDTITTNGWGARRQGTVLSIHITRYPWDKEGESVNSVDTNEHHCGTVSFYDGNHSYWCYIDDIASVTPAKKQQA